MSNDSMETKILIVDDQPANIGILIKTLEPEGYEVLLAPSGEVALKTAPRALPDLILLDILMPGMDGYKVCRRLKENPATRDIPVIFVTAKDETADVLEGFRLGGVDYITKPFEAEEVLVRVRTHLKINRLTKQLLQKNTELTQANEQLRQEIARREQAEDARQKSDERFSIISQRESERWGIAGFIGKSKTIRKILDEVRRLQDVSTTSVLILGESGTGKELIARALHFGSKRKNGPFIPVNCSTIPAELAESTLFGHTAGAFTGAKTSRRGYFELASGGTLFLDEIGDLPLPLQPKLLRVLEDGCITPIGAQAEKQVDVRIIAATNTNLEAKKAAGTFREDLYFRLARFPVAVPPLRERQEDIPLLAEHFMKMFAGEMGIEHPEISSKALAELKAYSFPGNVRELKNIIEYALIKSDSSVIQPEHLHLIQPNSQSPNFPATEILREAQEAAPLQNDNVREFIDECCEIVPYAEIHKPNLLAIYRSFCEQKGYQPASRNEFNQRILELCPQVIPTLIGKKRLTGFKGLKIKDSISENF